MRKILTKELEKLNIENTEEKIRAFELYANILLEWNKKMNLTSITDMTDIAVKHFADSISLLSVCKIPYGAKIIDVGCGAGFPGIPLKIVRPDICLTLLDSQNKRIEFLKECCTHIGLEDTVCIHSRAEDGAHREDMREKFYAAVSRAVAAMSTLCEYTLPYVTEGGFFAALKGPSAQEELFAAKNAIEILGGGRAVIKPVILPDTNLSHSIVLIDKIRPTPPKYPRKGNKPLSKPL